MAEGVAAELGNASAGNDMQKVARQMRDTEIDQDHIRVQHYQRKPGTKQFSLERVFEAVRRVLPADIIAETHVCRFESRRILRRILNIKVSFVADRYDENLSLIMSDAHRKGSNAG